jgi:hypothetical protein
MKKLMAICAVLLFVAPAFAADWSFYGSERLATWYVSRDYGDSVNQVNGNGNDAGTQWYMQTNSRFGAKVTADKVSGQIELATTASSTDSAGDGTVNTRRAYGIWHFSDNAFLKVGKDYSPVTDFISNQFFDADKDLYGEGNFYGIRPNGITLGVGNFQLAFLKPQQGDTGGIGSNNSGIIVPATNPATVNFYNAGAQATATGDPDVYLPKFEASYKLALGSGYIYPFAGFQWYQVKSYSGSQVTSDQDIVSYVLGVSTSWNIGAFSIGGQLSYGQNEGISGWANGYNNANSQLPVLKTGGDDIANIHTIQALIVPALKFTDTLRFEAGFGYRQDNADGAPGFSQKDDSWTGYVQALITLAPGVYLCPEIGYIDWMDNRAGNDEGYEWYAGAKWQIDF